MITIDIALESTGLREFPRWWNRFSHSVWQDPEYIQYGFSKGRVKKLAAAGGKLIVDNDIQITFENDRDATAFLLRWS